MIIERLGEDFVQSLAKPRYVRTDTEEFNKTLEAFVANNLRTEQRRRGPRDEETIRKHSLRGIVAEFALKQVPGVEDNCPLVADIRDLDKTEIKTDQTYNGFKIQTKSKGLRAKFWGFGESQYRSICGSRYANDFFVVVGVIKDFDNMWLAVPQLLIDARRINSQICKSSFNDGYYYNPTRGRHNREHVVLTELLKRDSIHQDQREVT